VQIDGTWPVARKARGFETVPVPYMGHSPLGWMRLDVTPLLLLLAAARTPLVVFGGVALWGLHMGLTQGLQASLVATTAPADLRGTAFGLFNLTTGVVLLLASVVAGLLWSRLRPSGDVPRGRALQRLRVGRPHGDQPHARGDDASSAREHVEGDDGIVRDRRDAASDLTA
jgi:hypothetical protein